MLAQEDNRWIVTLVSHFGKGAPSEVEGFIEFARTLPAPWIHDAVRDAEPIGDAATARFPASVWRRHDKLERFPEGYLVFGDATRASRCAFCEVTCRGTGSYQVLSIPTTRNEPPLTART